MPKYTIELPGQVKIPKTYKSMIEAYSTIGKLLKADSCKYIVVYQDDKFFRKVINNRYKRVENAEWMKAHNSGMFKDAFILNDNGTNEYYIKP
jgi:hypothetical protein